MRTIDALIVLITLLMLASLAAAVLGLVKPSLVRVRNGKYKRLKALGMYSGLAFGFMVIGAIIAPKQDNAMQVQGKDARESGIAVVVDEQAANRDTPDVLAYRVVGSDDTSFSTRKRLNFQIVTTAINPSYEQKALTVIQAAKDLQKQHGAQLVTVSLEVSPDTIGTGSSLARAEYAPDNGGYSGDQGWTWKVFATETNPSETEVAVLRAWYKNRSRFLLKDGLTVDEPALKSYIAKQLGLPLENISLPVMLSTPYPYK